MKNVLLSILFIFCFIKSFGQPVVNRSSQANTVQDARWRALYNAGMPIYDDTLSANIQKGVDSCYTIIATRDVNALWYRACSPKHWVQFTTSSGINIDSLINSLTGGSVISITHLGDTAIVICHGDGTCDTISITTTVVNISTVSFLDNTHIVVCDSLANCDTITIGGQSILYYLQSGVGFLPGTTIGELGGENHPLLHNTRLRTDYSSLEVYGYPVMENPLKVYQGQVWNTSPTIQSWGSAGGVAIDAYNAVKMNMMYTGNYIDGTYPLGLNNQSIGYFLGNNFTPIYTGLTPTDIRSKSNAIFVHSLDSLENNYGISFITMMPSSARQAYLPDGNTLEPKTRVNINQYGIQIPDGIAQTSGNGLVDSVWKRNWLNGQMYLAPPADGQVTILNDTTIIICSFGTELCDTNYFTNVGVIQNVFLHHDTLIVCGTIRCDTAILTGLSGITRVNNGLVLNSSGIAGLDSNQVNPLSRNVDINANYHFVELDNLNAFVAQAGTSGVASTLVIDSVNGGYMTATRAGHGSLFNLNSDSIIFRPFLGKVNIDSLRVGSSNDSVMTWNKQTGILGYRNASSFGISAITADNGLTASTSTNVQLGATASGANSPLLHNTFINTTASYYLEVNGSNTYVLRGVNTGSGYGVYGSGNVGVAGYDVVGGGTGTYGQTTDGNGIYGAATTSGVGGRFSASSYYGILVQSASGTPIFGQSDNPSNSTVVTLAELMRATTGGGGAGSNGMGGSIDFYASSTTNKRIVNQLISKWTDATDATRTSQLSFTGVNSGTTGTILSLNGDATAQFYGSIIMPYVAKTSTYTATTSDYTINATSGTFTVNLPTASGISGKIYVIKNSGAGTITIDGSGSETIDGATTKTLSVQYSGYTIQSDGTNWAIISTF